MNLRLFGVQILIQDSGAICLAFLLTAVSTTRSVPLGQVQDDAEDYGMEWEGTFESVWNKTKFWSSDLGAPTEYFPEDEGFIRVNSPQAKATPRPPNPKKPEPSKGNLKTNKDTQANRKLLQLTSDGDYVEEPLHPGRHLLQVDGGDSSSSSQTEEDRNLKDGGGATPNDWVDIFGGGLRGSFNEEEGSGEGSGYGSLDFSSQSPPAFVTETSPILSLTPNSAREI